MIPIRPRTASPAVLLPLFSSTPLRVFAVLLSVLAAVPLHASVFDPGMILDPRFDGDGVQFYQHPNQSDGTGDRPIANCPSGDGQIVISRAGNHILVFRRLFADGSPDGPPTGYILTHYDFMSTNAREDVALCRPDGSILLAMSITEPAFGATRILLAAVGADLQFIPDTFIPDSPGLVTITLGALSDGLKVPRSFNRTPDGGALLVGSAETPEGWRPFLIHVAGPTVQFAGTSFFVPPGLNSSIHATAAGVGPGGGFWVVGHGYATNTGLQTPYRAYLDPDDLSLAHTELFPLPGENVRTFGGGMVREGVMAVGASRQADVTQPAQPLLLVLRTGGVISGLDLPTPLPLVAGRSTGVGYESVGPALPQTGNRVLYAATAETFGDSGFEGYHGWYFARAVLGSSPAEDRIDTTFGDEGQAVISLDSGDGSCALSINNQHHARLGLWKGQPSVLGSIHRHCNPDSEEDLVLLRLRSADTLFDDGFE